MSTEIWAHRGASSEAPENTMAAFELAVEQGADGIELDVQRTSDGVVVVCHDETIDRTSNGTGAIAHHDLDDLRRHTFNAGMAGFECSIPTLAEVLDLVASTDLRVNIELKNSLVAYPGLEGAVEAVVQASRLSREAADRVVYSSFNHRSLAMLASSGTRIPLGVLHVEPLVRSWDYVRMVGAQALHPYWGSLADDEIAQCHAASVSVHPWTIDDPEVVVRAAQAGADALITNVPAIARGALEAGDGALG